MANTTVITRKDIINEVAERMGATKKSIKEVLDNIEVVVSEGLAQTDVDTDVEVKVLTGLSVIGTHVPAKECRNPQTGESMVAAAKNKAKAKAYKRLQDAANGIVVVPDAE